MIKNLRRKFIFAAMASTFGVLVVIMSILNIANYHKLVSNADVTLTELAESNGRFDTDKFMPPDDKDLEELEAKETGETNAADGQTPALANDKDGQKPDKPDDAGGPGVSGNEHFTAETPFQTRYFSVVVEDGEVTQCNLDNIAAIDEESAYSYAKQIIEDGSESGFSGIYRYLRSTNDGVDRIIFVDCGQEINSFRNTLVYSVGVSLGGFLIVLLLVLFWSKKIFKPVAESYEKQKRFITDASHEIKTPLTIIDANTEVIEMMGGESEWTQNTRTQVKRLTSLTNQMVSLSRLDENPLAQNVAEFNLSEAVNEVLDHFRSLAEVRGKSIKSDIAENVMYTGDENSLRQLVSILTDNAMKYADSSSDIEIRLKKDGRRVKLTLRNLTDGMAEGDQSILFERFYRPDSSRNSETGGSGIGLSLAASIAAAHKGKISARCDKDGYITFTVVM